MELGLKSQLDGRFAGSGTMLAFVEHDEMYRDKKIGIVRFPNDSYDNKEMDKLCKELSGEVKTYKLEDLK